MSSSSNPWSWGAPVAVIGGGLTLWALATLATGRHSVENAAYKVLQTLPGGIELRTYPKHTIASVTVPERALKPATSAGFRHLARFIFGGTATGETVAMTSPVITSAATPAGRTIAFVMPSKFENATALPAPLDGQVVLQDVDARVVAAVRLPIGTPWGGGAVSGEVVEVAGRELIKSVATAGWTPVGEPFLQQYDPPWAMWLMRRSEVAVVVERK